MLSATPQAATPDVEPSLLMSGLMISKLHGALAAHGYHPVCHHKANRTPLEVETVQFSRERIEQGQGDTLLIGASQPARNTLRYSVSFAISDQWNFDSPTTQVGEFGSWEELVRSVPSFASPDFGLGRSDALLFGSPDLPATLEIPLELVSREPQNDFTPVGLFAAWADVHESPFKVISHLEETITSEEKRTLIDSNPSSYEQYGNIGVAQGSLLTYRDGDENRYIILVHDGEERVNTKALKRELGISKKRDLKFADRESVYPLTGLLVGAVSPFIESHKPIDLVVFSNSLIDRDVSHSDQLYDFALAKDRSLLARPRDVLQFLRGHPLFSDRVRTAGIV